MSDEVLIWSFEHNAWWAPAACGYVATVAEAGLYTLATAIDICARANIARINEAIVPLPWQYRGRKNDPQRPNGVPETRRAG